MKIGPYVNNTNENWLKYPDVNYATNERWLRSILMLVTQQTNIGGEVF